MAIILLKNEMNEKIKWIDCNWAELLANYQMQKCFKSLKASCKPINVIFRRFFWERCASKWLKNLNPFKMIYDYLNAFFHHTIYAYLTEN